MKISFVTHDNFVGQASFYVRHWAPYFYNSLLINGNDFKITIGYDQTADVVVASRGAIDSRYAEYVKSKGQKLIIDYDDPLWECAKTEDGKPYGAEFTRRTKSLVKHADALVFSTSNLQDNFYDTFRSSLPSLVMDNSVVPIVEPQTKNKVIFYGGCTSDKLKMFSTEWFKALQHFVDRGYKIVSSVDIPVEHTKFNYVQWPSYLTEVAKIAPEYYVAPLSECLESKCKSDLKELEAWQLGAKFVGQGDPYRNSVPYGADADTIIKAIETAKKPVFDESRLVTSEDFVSRFLTCYSGIWRPNYGN